MASKPPLIPRPLEEFNYLDKFTIRKGDKLKIKSHSYYLDLAGVKHYSGVSGTYIFLCVVKDGILVREENGHASIFVYMGEQRTLPTGTVQKPHSLSLPKKRKVKTK